MIVSPSPPLSQKLDSPEVVPRVKWLGGHFPVRWLGAHKNLAKVACLRIPVIQAHPGKRQILVLSNKLINCCCPHDILLHLEVGASAPRR